MTLVLKLSLLPLLVAGILISSTCSATEHPWFDQLAQKCAPNVHLDTLRALVKTESAFNPYAIGVVGGKADQVRQPRNFQEAMITIAQLELAGKDYSVGLGQIYKKNFKQYGINAETALDACTNLRVAGQVLGACYNRASKNSTDPQQHIHDSLSCYYSGNFKTGYAHGYVNSVRRNAGLPKVPSIKNPTESTQISQSDNLIGHSSAADSGLIF